MTRAAAAAPAPVASLVELEARARGMAAVQPRVPLASATADTFREIDSLEPPDSGRVPTYLRALAVKPSTVKPFAHLI